MGSVHFCQLFELFFSSFSRPDEMGGAAGIQQVDNNSPLPAGVKPTAVHGEGRALGRLHRTVVLTRISREMQS
jgi:hypothetical protein